MNDGSIQGVLFQIKKVIGAPLRCSSGLVFTAMTVLLLLSGLARAEGVDQLVAAKELSSITELQNVDSNGKAVVEKKKVIAGQAIETESGIEKTLNGGLTASSETTPEAESESPVDETRSATLPHNLSPWGMFIAADWVVKSVMVGLAIASLLTWTVLVSKSIELGSFKKLLRRNIDSFEDLATLADAANSQQVSGVGRAFIAAAEKELLLSKDLSTQPGGKDGIKERVMSSLSRIEIAAARNMLAGTGLLATVGAVAPFVGLFGTVWGIMNAFIGISESNTTNLAVVAPGIAEALLATALGLVAAIPAVVIYNHFTRKIAASKALIADSAAMVMRLVSRDLDRALTTSSAKPTASTGR